MIKNYVYNSRNIVQSVIKNKIILNNRELPKRYFFLTIQKYVNDFLKNKGSLRWLIIPGLRGVGKSTLLAQTFQWISDEHKEINVMYLSLDELFVADLKIQDVLKCYLDDFTKNDQKVVFLLDEVQFFHNWAVVLKTIFDKNPNIFFVCSGSSAIHLQIDANIAGRRAQVEPLYPMSFIEYEYISNGVYPIKNLKSDLITILLDSKSVESCYCNLLEQRKNINEYIARCDRKDWVKYVLMGSLPFTLLLKEDAQIYTSINQIIEKVLHKDLVQMMNYDRDTILVAKRLLNLLAESDVLSVNKVAQLMNLSNITLNGILDSFCKSELLIRVFPLGKQFSVAKKSSKYFFSCSTIRSALFYFNGSLMQDDAKLGKILEDVAAIQFRRILGGVCDGRIFYDSAQGGADFIINRNNQGVVFEVGKGRKAGKQVAATIQRHNYCKYGITVCDTEDIALDSNNNSVIIPWRVFALAG